MKAAIYARVSTDDQEKEGTSLGSQVSACLNKANELGYDVPDDLIYKETFSGLRLSRPLLDELRIKAKNGDFNAVVVYSPDRLCRNGEDILLLLKEFKLAGIKLVLVKEQFEDSLTGKVVAFIFGWASELEAAQIKERTRRGKKTKAENGFLPQGTGLGLYGYKWDKATKKRVIFEYEAKAVQRIFNMISEGKTRFEVARELNNSNVPTKSGSKWHPLTIERIVTNHSYTGITYFGKTTRDGKQTRHIPREKWLALKDVTPPIISQELFDRAQIMLKESKELHRGRPQHEYLLTGHIKCGLCNSHAVGSCLLHKYRYYHCRNTYPTTISKATCNAGYINADTTENIVWREVRKVIENPQVILADLKRRVKSQNNGNGHKVETELADAKKKLQKCTTREQRLLSLFEFNSITREELLERVNKVRAEQQEIEKQLTHLSSIKAQTIDVDSLEKELTSFCDKVQKGLENCSFMNKRLALDILQVQVTATPGKINIKMAVPLEYTTIELKHEYTMPVRNKRSKAKEPVAL